MNDIKPVAYGTQAVKDGSWENEIVVCGWWSFDKALAKLRANPWFINGAATIEPLYDSAALTQAREEGRLTGLREAAKLLNDNWYKTQEDCIEAITSASEIK